MTRSFQTPTPTQMRASWSIDTPTARPGAIAVVTVRADVPAETDALFATLGIAPVAPGGAALRLLPFAGGEHAVVARIPGDSGEPAIILMPHAGLGATFALDDRVRHPTVLRFIGPAIDFAAADGDHRCAGHGGHRHQRHSVNASRRADGGL